MFNKCIWALVALVLAMGVMIGVAGPAGAHTGTLSGTTTCNVDGSWSVLVTVNVTNTPDNNAVEVKATDPTGSPGVVNTGGTGVMSGGQVILNAWYEHRNNWPGVKTRTGNFTDKYTINVPANVASVLTHVQIDWKDWGSADPGKTFNKPTNCTAYVPKVEREQRDVTGEPDCVNWTVTTEHQSRSRTETSKDVWGPWSAWATESTTATVASDEACRPPAPPRETQQRDSSTRPSCDNPTVATTTEERFRDFIWNAESHTYVAGPWSAWMYKSKFFTTDAPSGCARHAKVRVKVVDLCSCHKDDVIMFGNPDKVQIYKHRVNRTTWKFVVQGKSVNGHQYLLPKHLGAGQIKSGWRASQVYTFHTTAKPCPCKVRGDCHKLYPHFNPPHNCVGRLGEGKVCH